VLDYAVRNQRKRGLASASLRAAEAVERRATKRVAKSPSWWLPRSQWLRMTIDSAVLLLTKSR
jgi:hypothetical protein